MPVIWEGFVTGGGEGGISHPKLCAGAGERSGGPGEDSMQYFSKVLQITGVLSSLAGAWGRREASFVL